MVVLLNLAFRAHRTWIGRPRAGPSVAEHQAPQRLTPPTTGGARAPARTVVLTFMVISCHCIRAHRT